MFNILGVIAEKVKSIVYHVDAIEKFNHEVSSTYGMVTIRKNFCSKQIDVAVCE